MATKRTPSRTRIGTGTGTKLQKGRVPSGGSQPMYMPPGPGSPRYDAWKKGQAHIQGKLGPRRGIPAQRPPGKGLRNSLPAKPPRMINKTRPPSAPRPRPRNSTKRR